MRNQERIFLLVAFLTGTIYNFSNPYIRVVLILLWIITPFLFFLMQNFIVLNGQRNAALNQFLTLNIISFLLFSVPLIVNSSTANFNLSVFSVEALTPLLIILVLPYSIFLKSRHNIPLDFLKHFLDLLIFILSVDLLYRLSKVGIDGFYYVNRNLNKQNSLFSTSNIIGQFLAFFLTLFYSLKIPIGRLRYFLLILFLLLSFSRSAILSSLIVIILIYFLGTKSQIKKLLLLIGIVSLAILISNFILSDGSLETKFVFIYRFFDLLSLSAPFNLFFGYGLSIDNVIRLFNVNGWSPHLPLLKSFLYFGFFGIFGYLFHLISFWFFFPKMRWSIITWLMISLSGAPIFWPTLLMGSILAEKYRYYED